MSFISDIVTNTNIDSKSNNEIEYTPITKVFAFEKGSINNIMYCETREGKELLKKIDAETKEKRRILKRHLFSRLMGASEEDIYAKYGRNAYGNKINSN